MTSYVNNQPLKDSVVNKVKNFLGFSAGVSQLPQIEDKPIKLNTVYYLHLRWYSSFHPEKFDSYIHLMPWGGATIAYRYNGLTVEFGISECRSSDNFNKRIGRDIALARLINLQKTYEFHHHPTNQEVIERLKNLYYSRKEVYQPEVRKEYQ